MGQSSSLHSNYILVDDDVTRQIILELYNKNRIRQSDLIRKLTKKLKVSDWTIRDRLNKLEELGIIKRVYSTDMKSFEVILNKSKVKLDRNWKYYMDIYYTISASAVIAGVLTLIFGYPIILFGAAIPSIAILSRCIYNILTNNDFILVKLKVKEGSS